ncbi:MAG TPA: class I SAM-dependent methyltransferase [Planctomycetota bacterium]|nr:class I SAM-dependent methyltransferase [Planctomycetota bacterium]
MKIDPGFLLDAYSHPGAVRDYSRAVDRVGLWKSEAEFFGRHLLREGRLLDLGCGAGRTTFGLYRRGCRNIVGADLSPALIRLARDHAARRHLGLRFRVADACKLPFASGSFDGCLFSFNGLMTIPRRARRIAALREVRRVLAPGGRFVFTTHERGDDARWRKERVLWNAGRQDPRLHEFGDEVVEELGRPTFVHVPHRREILDCLDAARLEWLEDAYPGLTRESKAVRDFVSFQCRFWAARRKFQGSRSCRRRVPLYI